MTDTAIKESASTIGNVVDQIQALPWSVGVVALLVAMAYAFRLMDVFPNRFIPISIWLLGGVIWALTGDIERIPKTQRFPVVVLAGYGVLLGVFSTILFVIIRKKFGKYIPGLGSSGASQPQPKLEPDHESFDDTTFNSK